MDTLTFRSHVRHALLKLGGSFDLSYTDIPKSQRYNPGYRGRRVCFHNCRVSIPVCHQDQEHATDKLASLVHRTVHALTNGNGYVTGLRTSGNLMFFNIRSRPLELDPARL